MPEFEYLTKDEKSLLLFFETCYVDHGGLVCGARMNDGDFEIAERWNTDGFIKFERICAADVKPGLTASNHCVKLTPDAMTLAHKERWARAERCWNSRKRRTISEFHAED